MTPGLIQRHHDYVLGPNQDGRLASVAVGAAFTLELSLDSDAPFLLRSRAMRVKYADDRIQTGLGNLKLRFAGPNLNYFAQDLIRQNLYAPYFGQLGNPIPVYPQVFYPRQSVITVDIQNDGASALTNLTLYFRGVKLFSPGQVKSYTYPPTFGVLPYVYPQGTFSAADGLTLVRSVPVTGSLRQTFRCKPDADFVFRAGQAGPLRFTSNDTVRPINEVFIRLRDEDEKPYSNDVVHLDTIFGNSDGNLSYFPSGAGGSLTPTFTGPNSPGLMFPEIYLPKNHVMYFDITRADSSYADVVAVDIPIAFIGQKVFAK